jgi:predicted esterase YcpF (UPF0227 family)
MAVIFYIHGFLSSAKAHKAALIRDYIKQQQLPVEFIALQLDDYPANALAFLKQTLEQAIADANKEGKKVYLIGSSLGGFYATWLAQYYGLKAVLLNPAVRPHQLMAKYLGEQVGELENPYTSKRFTLTETDMQVLKAHYVDELVVPENLLVILQMADEVLDATEAAKRFIQSPCVISPGGNHQFEHFEQYIAHLLAWLLNGDKKQ